VTQVEKKKKFRKKEDKLLKNKKSITANDKKLKSKKIWQWKLEVMW
jgi:hypothetical protein